MFQSIFGAIFSAITILSPGAKQVPTIPPLMQTCLDVTTATQGIAPRSAVPAVLRRVVKPKVTDFVSGQGWDLPPCIGSGDCAQQAEENDYVLVAEKVVMDPIIFKNSFTRVSSPSDRQLIRYLPDALISNDPVTQAQVRGGRMFRTFCGDWCVLNLPFRGSFHCDLLLYLHDVDEKGKSQIDPTGKLLFPHPSDGNLPKNGSLFSVYFRKGAPIPDAISCNPQPTVPVAAYDPRRLLEYTKKARAQNISSIIWPPKTATEWIFVRDGEVKNTEINPDVLRYPDPKTGSVSLIDPAGFSGEYEVFRHLSYPTNNGVLYLVPKGEYEFAMSVLSRPTPTSLPFPQPTIFHSPPIVTIKFKEFYPMNSTSGVGAKSLQLGTFELPRTVTWIKKWYEESKPAIYLYPEKETRVHVQLEPRGHITVSDPEYDPVKGWDVMAYPDGKIKTIDPVDDLVYPYLFYEAKLEAFPIPPTGFVVRGDELRSYLFDVLPQLGLNAQETDDFIVYWMHRLSETQPYYFIHFLNNETIEWIEPMTLSVEADTYIRIRPYFRPIDHPHSLPPQDLPTPPVRRGFTVVEWGGILDQ